MLIVDGLSAWYGEAQALREVWMRVDEGEIVTRARPRCCAA
jgi:branched-chain amino acid transport system ATP-binding protein